MRQDMPFPNEETQKFLGPEALPALVSFKVKNSNLLMSAFSVKILATPMSPGIDRHNLGPSQYPDPISKYTKISSQSVG